MTSRYNKCNVSISKAYLLQILLRIQLSAEFTMYCTLELKQFPILQLSLCPRQNPEDWCFGLCISTLYPPCNEFSGIYTTLQVHCSAFLNYIYIILPRCIRPFCALSKLGLMTQAKQFNFSFRVRKSKALLHISLVISLLLLVSPVNPCKRQTDNTKRSK